jgi:hypothetical protein
MEPESVAIPELFARPVQSIQTGIIQTGIMRKSFA